jgi:hypothetical protein
MKSLNAVLIALSLCAVATGCGGASTSLGDSPTITGKLEAYSGGAKVLKVVSGSGGAPIGTFGGTLNADGTFSVTLPGGASLTTNVISVGSECTSVVITPPDAKSASIGVNIFDSATATTASGSIYQGDERQAETPLNGTVSGLVRLFTDKDTTIKGNCTLNNVTTKYDLNLKTGWNNVLLKATFINGEPSAQEFASSTPNLPWRFNTAVNLFDLK